MSKHLLNIMATWRLYRLLSSQHNERGPYAILEQLRTHAQIQTLQGSDFWYEVNEAIECKYCLTIWCGLVIATISQNSFIHGLAYSAGALLYDMLMERLEINNE